MLRWFRAAGEGDLSTLREMLIDRVEVLNSQDSAGLTALHHAAATGAVSALLYLIESGADVHRKSSVGETALFKAAAAGQARCLELLVSAGCNFQEKDSGGAGLVHAVVLGGDPALIERVAGLGCDVDVQDKHGWTPLMLAVKTGSLGMTAALLDIGADLEISNISGLNALSLSKKIGSRSQTALLRRFMAATAETGSQSLAGEERDETMILWEHTLGLLSSFDSTNDDAMAERAAESMRSLFRLFGSGAGTVKRAVLFDFASDAEATIINELCESDYIDEAQFGVILMALATN